MNFDTNMSGSKLRETAVFKNIVVSDDLLEGGEKETQNINDEGQIN